VLGFDKPSWLLALAYLKNGKDFTEVYEKESFIQQESIDHLLKYLKQLHRLSVKDFPDNQKMKALNHQHIFILPYLQENGFDLDKVQEGLQQLSSLVKDNPVLTKKIKLLGERYLGQGKALLHGDFYPGSWLNTEKGLKIIDTEFAFMGDPEFDLGIMLAHLKLAQVSETLIQHAIKSYPLENAILAQYTGIEILRRLFGLAQLPLSLSLLQKKELATNAVNLILNEKI
jgi:5-methylthioribose kinase